LEERYAALTPEEEEMLTRGLLSNFFASGTGVSKSPGQYLGTNLMQWLLTLKGTTVGK
jgi:hypothetical protein